MHLYDFSCEGASTDSVHRRSVKTLSKILSAKQLLVISANILKTEMEMSKTTREVTIPHKLQ